MEEKQKKKELPSLLPGHQRRGTQVDLVQLR